jgi:choline dehydrogenase
MILQDQVDYLIVGAGTAGCVLANRLSAQPDVDVTLMEAGTQDKRWLIETPAAVGGLMRHPVLNWNFKTAPQRHAGDRVIPVPRGKVLGGTGSINGMVYTRGHPRDFDEWAALGNPGWSYRDVLPYFVRSENNERFRDSPFHGVGGPMNVKAIEPHNPLVDRFVDAARSRGYAFREDFNAIEQEGFGPRQATIRRGRRESTATAFLRPALSRDNLAVVPQALARRILIEGGRVVGVEYESDGKTKTVGVRKEVILCAGSIGSPQLLLLSGVGEASALQKLGIGVTSDLSGVGWNLQDHYAITFMMRTADSTSYGLSWKALPRNAWWVLDYLLRKRGPLASNVFEAHGFVRTSPALDRPDIQIIFIPAHRNASGFPIPFGHGFGINIALLRPRSRGAVSLVSPDPRVPPLIDPCFLSEPEDLAPLIEGFKIAREILSAPPFATLRATEIQPGPGVVSNEQIEHYIRSTGFTVFHPVGTCRMGSDAAAVVDPQLRVKGVEGLRIADASIFPRIVGGNTNAAVVMVAEKAADLILGRPPPPPIDPPISA